MSNKPFISANQVTGLRLALIWAPCWLLYQGPSGQYAGLIFATLLGCTDFVDGYLARKYGTTVLGGLMDPIADKVFIAVTFLPAVDLNWLPAWMVAALFTREFLVTAARSSFERRNLQLKSSYLSRYKTWVQMAGLGVLMLLHVAPVAVNEWVLGLCGGLAIVGFALRYVTSKKIWRGAAAFAPSFSVLFVVHRLWGAQATSVVLGWYIVGITWASGFGYVLALNKLRGREDASPRDLIRPVTAIAFPILAVLAQIKGHAPPWALIPLVSIEMAFGGLDNLLAHHKVETRAGQIATRMGSECMLLALAAFGGSAQVTMIATSAACLIALYGFSRELVQKRKYYLDEVPA